MASADETYDLLTMLVNAYPNVQIGADTSQIYAAMLQDISVDVLRAAIADHISKSKWFPTVAEIRETAVRLSVPGIYHHPIAAEAWNLVCQHIVAYGRDWSPAFDDKRIQQTVEAMGWRQLCMSTNQVADRARFIDAYEQIVARTRVDAQTLPQIRDLVAKLAAPGQRAGELPTGDVDQESNDGDL